MRKVIGLALIPPALLLLVGSLIVIGTASAQLSQHVNYTNITGQGTTQIKPAPGILHTICFNSAASTEVLTMWDSLTASGTKIGTITIPAGQFLDCLTYNVNFNIGLTIQTATASSDITVVWE